MKRLIWPVLLLLPVTVVAETLPTGGSVSAGSATITTPSANQLLINQTDNRAVLRWDSFSTSAGAGVTFNQPGKTAATLNIVNGSTASSLAGSLDATGSVFLINPHGITVTPTGTVNTGGAFVASTLTAVNEANFMSGGQSFEFTGDGGKVLNQGNITAQDVLLLGERVENTGTILAQTGRVALGAASHATLDLDGDGFLQVLAPSVAPDDNDPLISSSGTITAGALVEMRAATAYSAMRNAINLSGDVQATGVSGTHGAIVFNGGAGGKLTVTGNVDATPQAEADSGGEVEMIAAVVDADLGKVAAGKGGHVMLGADDITIDMNEPGSTVSDRTYIVDRDLGGIAGGVRNGVIKNLLRSGTDVTLYANRNLDWKGGLMIGAGDLVAEAEGRAGNLHLLAGSEVSLGGMYSTLNGDWTLTANVPDLFGLPFDPGGPYNWSSINMFSGGVPGFAQFVNDNGHLTLEILDGDRQASSIQLPISYSGSALTARIDSGVDGYDYADIRFLGDISVAGELTLDGHLRATSQGGGILTLSGERVDWVTEKTGGRFSGGWVRFVEDGLLTRYGIGAGGPTGPVMDAVRLELGSNKQVSRQYGDSDPDQDDLSGGLLRVAAHNTEAVDENDLAGLLAPGSVDVTGPGGTADVGLYQLALTATADFAAGGGWSGEGGPDELPGGGEGSGGIGGSNLYRVWIDVTGGTDGATVPLAITPRPITATLLNPADYDYGSPLAAIRLNGVINGDDSQLRPVGSVDGQAASYHWVTDGYGLPIKTAVGAHSYVLNGLSGNKAGNYVLDLAGLPQGLVNITRRAITFSGDDGHKMYGDTDSNLSALLHDTLAGDQVSAVAGLMQDGNAVVLDQRTAAGSYQVVATGLSGADADNYVLASSGNMPGLFTVNPKPLNWSVADANSVYGSFVPGEVSLDGVLFDDTVTASVGLWEHFGQWNSARINQPGQADVGDYTAQVVGIDNANYVLATSGNQTGQHEITPRLLKWSVEPIFRVYGDFPAEHPVSRLGDVVYLDVMSWDLGEVRATEVIIADADGNPVSLTNRSSVGDYQQVVTGISGLAMHNYVLAPSDGRSLYHITPRPLTVAGSQYAISTYGELLNPDVMFDGLLSGDEVVVSQFLARDEEGFAFTPAARTDAGYYDLSVTGIAGADVGNYVLATSGNATIDWTVRPRPVGWSLGQGSMVYGDTNIADHVLLDLLPGDDVSAQLVVRPDPFRPDYYVPLEDARLDVGVYPARVGGLTGYSASNYTFQGSTESTLEVTPRPLTWTLPTVDQVYGDAVSLWPVQFNNLAYNDSFITAGAQVTLYDSDNQAISLPFSPGFWVNVGSYATQVTGLDNPNYVLASSGNQAGTINIVPRQVHYYFSASAQNATYGDYRLDGNNRVELPTINIDSPLPVGSQVTWGDSIIELPQYSAGGYVQAGTYNIIPLFSGPDAGNYELIGSPGTLFIRPKEILRSSFGFGAGGSNGENGERQYVYGSLTDINLTQSVNALNFGDEAKITLPDNVVMATDRSSGGYLNAGDYYFRLDLTGDDAANYRLEGDGEFKLSISPKNIRFPVIISDQHYGDTFYQVGAAPLLLEGDLVTIGELVLSGASPVSGAFEDWYLPHAGNILPTLTALDVGSYQIKAGSLAGLDAGNYNLQDSSPARFNVTPLPITLLPQHNVVHITYGDLLSPQNNQFALSYYNATLGEQVSLLGSGWVFNERLGVDAALPKDYLLALEQGRFGRADAGTYGSVGVNRLTTDSPEGWRNFKLVNPDVTSGQIIVDQRLLTVSYRSPDDYVYGSGNPDWFPQLSGILPVDTGDDWVAVAPVATGSDGRHWTWYPDIRLPVDSYRYGIDLVSDGGGNYRLAEPVPEMSFTVTPRELQWFVPYSRIQYGNFEPCDNPSTCHAPPFSESQLELWLNNPSIPDWVIESALRGMENYWQKYNIDPDSKAPSYSMYVPATEAQPELLGGVLPGDDIQAITGLIDFNGQQGKWDDKPPVGVYFHVVEGLTGAAAGNYVLAESGNVPGMLTVEPQWVRWNTQDALYTPETGFINMREADLFSAASYMPLYETRPDTPVMPASVKSIIAIKTATGAPVNVAEGIEPGVYQLHVVGLTGEGSENYRVVQSRHDSRGNTISHPGHLSVFADTTFGMETVDRVDLALPPPSPTGSAADSAEENDHGASDDWEREDSASCDGDGCGVNRQVSREDKVEFGSGNINLSASSYVEALARVGSDGITLKVDAEQRISIDYEIGPGYINETLLARQQAQLTVGKDGVELTGEVEASLSATVGAKGDMGGGAEGDINASAESFAKAKVTMQARIENGKLKVEQSVLAGAGAKVGVQGEIGGETGSVNAGGVVYSPGSFGFEPSFEVGFSDGRLKVDFGLGVAFGLFGGGFELGFEIDFNKIGEAIKGVVNAVGCKLGFGGCPPSPNDYAQTAYDMEDNPVARFRYMAENPEWLEAGSFHHYGANKIFFDTYMEKVKNVETYLAKQKSMQEELAAAIEGGQSSRAAYLARDLSTFDWQGYAKDLGIRPQDLAELGIQLEVKDGNMTFSNIK